METMGCVESLAGKKWTIKTRLAHTYRFASDVPPRDGDDALFAGWCEIVATDAAGRVLYKNSFATTFAIDKDNGVVGRIGWRRIRHFRRKGIKSDPATDSTHHHFIFGSISAWILFDEDFKFRIAASERFHLTNKRNHNNKPRPPDGRKVRKQGFSVGPQFAPSSNKDPFAVVREVRKQYKAAVRFLKRAAAFLCELGKSDMQDSASLKFYSGSAANRSSRSTGTTAGEVKNESGRLHTRIGPS